MNVLCPILLSFVPPIGRAMALALAGGWKDASAGKLGIEAAANLHFHAAQHYIYKHEHATV